MKFIMLLRELNKTEGVKYVLESIKERMVERAKEGHFHVGVHIESGETARAVKRYFKAEGFDVCDQTLSTDKMIISWKCATNENSELSSISGG